MIEMEYNSHEVVNMTEKEALISLIDKLDTERVIILKKVVEAMIYPAYPEEELSPEEKERLQIALKEVEEGKVVEGKELDDLFE